MNILSRPKLAVACVSPVIVSAVLLLLAWALTLWGQTPWNPGTLVLMWLVLPTLSMFMTFVVVGSILPDKFTDTLGVSMLAAAVLSVGVGLVGLRSDRAQDNRLAFHAIARIDRATEIMGSAPAIAQRVRAATATRTAIAQNRELLQEVGTATVGSESLLVHLAAANALNVEAPFVRDNGLIREQDRQALLREAITQAKQGNVVATQWSSVIQKGVYAAR